MSSTGSNDSNTVTEACSDVKPPQMTVSLPRSKDLVQRSKDPSCAPLPVDFLLLTVKDCEFLACYRQLVNPFRCWFANVGHVYFDGVRGDERVKIALIRCYEGSSGPGSSIMVVPIAVTLLRPKAVISVGICSSIDPQRAKLGDVVVSAIIKIRVKWLESYCEQEFSMFHQTRG